MDRHWYYTSAVLQEMPHHRRQLPCMSACLSCAATSCVRAWYLCMVRWIDSLWHISLGVQGGAVVKAIDGWYAYLEVKDTSSNGVSNNGTSSNGTSFNGTEQRRGDDDHVKEQMEVWRVYECPFGACGANNSCKGKLCLCLKDCHLLLNIFRLLFFSTYTLNFQAIALELCVVNAKTILLWRLTAANNAPLGCLIIHISFHACIYTYLHMCIYVFHMYIDLYTYAYIYL